MDIPSNYISPSPYLKAMNPSTSAEMLRARQSKVISTLRFPLTFAVLFIHVLPFSMATFVEGRLDYNVYVFISELLSHRLFGMVVPCFFVISGYYFFASRQQWSPAGYLSEMRKRASTLLLPFLLWNFLYMGLIFLKGQISMRLGVEASDYSMLENNSLWELLTMPVDFPLWYLRDLICLSLLTPAYYIILRHLPRLVMLGLLLVVYALDLGISPVLSSGAIVYFGLGAYVAMEGQTLLGYVRPLWRFALPLWIMLGVAPFFTDIHQLEHIFIPLGIISLIGLADAYLDRSPRMTGLMIRLVPVCFFVYALHLVYIESWIKGFFSRTPLYSNGWGMLVAYFLTPCITLAICLGLYYAMRRWMPRTLGILCGGR